MPTFRNTLFHLHRPMKMEQIECSETSAYTIETPGNYPKENILYKLMFLSEWREFPSTPCLEGKETWRQLASPFCWNRARPWHASELVTFLVGLRTYQHVRDARDFNNIETQAVIIFFFLQGKEPKEIHAILTEPLACFLPGLANDLSACQERARFQQHWDASCHLFFSCKARSRRKFTPFLQKH